MSDENDRDAVQGSSTAFFTGLFAGALIGTGLGVLFAPRRGAELRGQVAESASNVGQAISKSVDGWSERGRQAFDQARDLASRASDEVERVASDASKTVDRVMNVAGDMVANATRRGEKQAASRT